MRKLPRYGLLARNHLTGLGSGALPSLSQSACIQRAYCSLVAVAHSEQTTLQLFTEVHDRLGVTQIDGLVSRKFDSHTYACGHSTPLYSTWCQGFVRIYIKKTLSVFDI